MDCYICLNELTWDNDFDVECQCLTTKTDCPCFKMRSCLKCFQCGTLVEVYSF